MSRVFQSRGCGYEESATTAASHSPHATGADDNRRTQKLTRHESSTWQRPEARRFGRIRSVAAYFGIIPCQDASSTTNRLGHITKEGPSTVRKLLTEAAWQAIRRSKFVGAIFERIRHDDPQRKKIALVATAHYLLRVMTAMLRSGECWRHDGAKKLPSPRHRTRKLDGVLLMSS